MLRKQYLFYVFFIFASHTKCGNIVSVTFFKISFLHTTQKSHKQCCTLEYVMLFHVCRIADTIELPSIFFFQTQMLGVLHLSRSFWLWYLLHLSIDCICLYLGNCLLICECKCLFECRGFLCLLDCCDLHELIVLYVSMKLFVDWSVFDCLLECSLLLCLY